MNEAITPIGRRRPGRDRVKGRADTGWFFRIPVAVLESENYRALTFKARALLMDMGAQFRGGNNGDLAASWSMLRAMGWKSKDTLQRATKELIDAGMIEQTRWGGLHCCNLYAFTWLPIAECGGKLDVDSTKVASALWRKSTFAERKKKTPRPPRRPGHTAPTAVVASASLGPTGGTHCPENRH